MTIHIKRPIITEKSIKLAEAGKFTFEVDKQSNKDQIKKSVQDAFNVHVVDVATQIVKGRRKRIGARRIEVKVSPWKKAVVTVKQGEKIELFNIGEKK